MRSSASEGLEEVEQDGDSVSGMSPFMLETDLLLDADEDEDDLLDANETDDDLLRAGSNVSGRVLRPSTDEERTVMRRLGRDEEAFARSRGIIWSIGAYTRDRQAVSLSMGSGLCFMDGAGSGWLVRG